jgi:hypothetical protein
MPAKESRPRRRGLQTQGGLKGRPAVPEDLFFTLAEVGVAFAGFAGLVTVLAGRARRSRERAELDLVFLHTVLATSLSVVAFALLPPSLVEMGMAPDVAVRTCAALFLAASIGYGSWSGPRASAAYKDASVVPPWTWRLNIVLAFVQWAVLLLCAFGILSSELYVGALLFFLYLSGSSFFRVFMSVGRTTSSVQ